MQIARVWLLLISSSLACVQAEPRSGLQIEVTVHEDQGPPMVGIPISVNGSSGRTTGAEGKVLVDLQLDSPRVRLEAACPAGFHSPEPRSLPVGKTEALQRLQVQFACRPTKRSLLLVVRAPQVAGTQVLVDGEPIGAVGDDGTLHAVIRRVQGSDVRFSLDTSSFPNLLPQYPTRAIHVADQDELVVFDQEFGKVAARPRVRPRSDAVRRAQAAPVSTSHRPYAIGSRY